ncbi:MAG: hypothetical protein ABSB30_01200 [Terracidiphilus sp.]
MSVARNFEIESIWLVRTLFRLRAVLLGAPMPAPGQRLGLISQMLGLGWKCLDEDQNRYFVAGTACKPWEANVVFSPIAAGQFAAFAEPDQVKIAWTIESNSLGPDLTRFATETRVAATDEQARKKFRRYWRKFGVGIVLIRLVLLPAVRHRAERIWRASQRER